MPLSFYLLINPLKEDDVYIEFIYVYKEDLGLTTRIFPVKILPYDTFFEYFELELTSKEVNNLIFDLRSSEHEQTDRN